MSVTMLKRIALLAMAVNYIGAFIPGMPIWFQWIDDGSYQQYFCHSFCGGAFYRGAGVRAEASEEAAAAVAYLRGLADCICTDLGGSL